MRFGRLLLLLMVVVAACSSSTEAIAMVHAPTARDLIAEPGTVLLDIRTPQEFAEVRIEGAINLDFYAPDFAAQIAALDQSVAYVVYCRSGNRSEQAMEMFRDLRFTEVHELEGGILTWLDAGLPTVSG